jgi:hypothetical protein
MACASAAITLTADAGQALKMIGKDETKGPGGWSRIARPGRNNGA